MNSKSFGRVTWNCFVDLGVTVVYATIAGFLIVGIVATDDAPHSLLDSVLYASLLPASATTLIGLDVALQLMAERRALQRRAARVTPRPALHLSRS